MRLKDVSATDYTIDTLNRAEAGHGLSRRDALLLAESADLASLCQAARALTDHSKSHVVSYSKKVFIPLTHLCRDYCGYCTFRSDPDGARQLYMTPEDVLAVALAGQRAGCKEALFSLGDQPESIFPEAKAELQKLGFQRTLQYLEKMALLVLEETGLLPHSNPGLMNKDDLQQLKESNVSVGLMLESVSNRLLRNGEAHWKAPDKVPALRLKTIEEAGRQKMAFTTGILIGIGETAEDRVDTLFAIDRLHKEYGHIQEVIVQPFRPKPGTRMEAVPEASLDDLKRTIAIARLILGADMNIQSPPNLLLETYPGLLDTGLNDWGGISPVTQDFINPEAAWPQIAALTRRTAAAGFVLRERLAIYPEYASREEFISPRVESHLSRFRGEDGYAREEIS